MRDMSLLSPKLRLAALLVLACGLLVACQTPRPAVAWDVSVTSQALSVSRSSEDTATASVIVAADFDGTEPFSLDSFHSEVVRATLYEAQRRIDFPIDSPGRYLVRVVEVDREYRFSVVAANPPSGTAVEVSNWPSVLATDTLPVYVSTVDNMAGPLSMLGLLGLTCLAVLTGYKIVRG